MKSIVLVVLITTQIFANPRLIPGNNHFAASVYKAAVNIGEENFLISPVYAEMILALLQSVTNGKTAKEIDTILQISPDEETKIAYQILLQHLKTTKDLTLRTANKIYFPGDVPIKTTFSILATDYLAQVENVNLAQKIRGVYETKRWIDNNSGQSSALTLPAVIVNSLYLKANNWMDDLMWHTADANELFKTQTKVIKLNTWIHFGPKLNYYEDLNIDADFLELPCEGDDIQIVLVIPKIKEGLKNVEQHVEEIFKPHSFVNTAVHVALPKFQIRSTIDFKEIFQKMGVRKIFEIGEADFSGSVHLAVSGIFQRTSIITANQNGIEAPSASRESFYASSFPKSQKNFVVDRSFLFYINVRNMTLFAGRVVLE